MKVENPLVTVARVITEREDESERIIERLRCQISEQEAELTALKNLTNRFSRVIGTFIACQHFNVTPRKFPMPYTGFVISVLSGQHDYLIRACDKFVNDMQPALEEKHKEKEHAQ